MSYEVKILADSIARGTKVRLTTIQATFPRIVLAEFNTHRVFSRNSASSRAIPVSKNIERVLADPFVPAAFAANQKGMQAGEEFDEQAQRDAEFLWLDAMKMAVAQARQMALIGVHKQWANRLLEPFSWHTAIISATEWENFFALRCSPKAAPEIRTIAEMMREAMVRISAPRALEPGEWHLPLVETIHDSYSCNDFVPDDRLDFKLPLDVQVKLSVARCARVSYLTHEGKRDIAADLELYERLRSSGHLSPFEHAARVATDEEPMGPASTGPYASGFYGNFRMPWVQHRKDVSNEAVFKETP